MRLMKDYWRSELTSELAEYSGVSHLEVAETADAINDFLVGEGQQFSSDDIVRMAKAFYDVSAEYSLEQFLELAEVGC
jgi:hypothetical protein